MAEFVIYAGAPSGNVIGGPFAVQVLKIEANGATKQVALVSGILSAQACDQRAAEYAASYGVRIASQPVAANRPKLALALVDNINFQLAERGLDPLYEEQIECLRDPARVDEANGMLDDMQARVGLFGG